MNTSGSEISLDSSESSADGQSADLTPAQIAQSVPAIETQNFDPPNSTIVDEDDSDSDVSMSAETDEEEDEARPFTIQVNPIGRILEDQPTPMAGTDTPKEATNKRKYGESMEEAINGHVNVFPEDGRKRLKSDDELQSLRTSQGTLRQDKSLLPAEIWHHIFTFIPPRSLGLLLRVNKCFCAYLDASFTHPIIPLSRSASKILKPDAIWKASRVLFCPGMPAPLTGKSELDMWKLACSSSCQFCGKKQSPNPYPVDQWHPGPGENGNIPIWSFEVRTCGPCLQHRSSKEIDLLLSSSVPSILIPALPFIFFTNELHILPATTLQNGHPPPTVQITKQFFQPQIEEIKKEFTAVQSMGTATAEEWIKGLDERGKERRGDAARWEKWEAGGGIVRMLAMESQDGTQIVAPIRTATPSTASTGFAQISQPTNGYNPAFQPQTSTQLPHQIHTSFPMKPPARFDSPGPRFGAYQRPNAPSRVERTKEEVAELKAARRAEIEKRCMELDPPLTAGVLAHMSSFQAAIQIIQPLDDGAWEVLKPRLLSQRQDAEQREKDRLAQSRVVQEHHDEQNRYQSVNIPLESKDILDREWDDVQAPLRTRLTGYADEIIRDGWNDGEKVSHDNSPTFAAEVLLYVRKRFYAEVAKDEAALRATSREPEPDPPNGPFTRKLILENMKWIFDTKIKPHTEQHRKELFLCNDCEVNFKYYGFEGVIQHFAAKHTTALSSGSIVVHWRAEWPEYPPFDPEPANASTKNPYYATVPSASASYAPLPTHQNHGYGGYQPTPVSAPMQTPNPHVYQESPGPYYGHPQFGEQYSGHQNGPYAPPQIYPDNSGSYQAQYPVPLPVGGNVPGFSEPPQDYSQQGFGGPYPASTQGIYASPHPGQLYPATIPEIAPQQYAYAPQRGQNGYSYHQPVPQSTMPSAQFTSAPLKTEEYKSQLQDVARNARAVWDSVYNLKDVPGSVKVYTIVYHILQKSRAKFEEDPPLSMIIDGLSNNKDMRKVRNISGLLCKACSLGLPGSTNASAKRHQSFPQLANHFFRDHEKAANNAGPVPDWTKDMIKLPDLKQLNSVPKSRGMDDKKLKLISEALPEIFSTPLRTEDRNDHAGPTRTYEEPANHDPYALAPSHDNHDKYYTTVDSGKSSEVNSVPYDNGQYDPRNPRDPRDHQIQGDPEPGYKIIRRLDDYQEPGYTDRKAPDRPRYEQRPVSPPGLVRAADPYGRVVLREEAPIYLERPIRYRDEPEVEYRVRHDLPTLNNDDPDREYRFANTQSYQSNRHESQVSLSGAGDPRETRYLPAEEAATQQNRTFGGVTQMSQQSQLARPKHPVKLEPVDGGSEDGELRALPISNVEKRRSQEYNEASNAADRFLDAFQAGESLKPVPLVEGTQRRQGVLPRAAWEGERVEDLQSMYDHPRESILRARDIHNEEDKVVRGRLIDNDQHERPEYVVQERAPQLREARYAYDDHYASKIPEHAASRERSPELVDRRYKLNNVVYREERQSSHSMHRTPSRYARYESVRLENDRTRSRSPVYVKSGLQTTQYRDRSPPAHPPQLEPIYRSRTPHASAEEVTFERAPPRQEFYRVYADESRPRPQYVETFEYVQVSDPNGDYMIRRPVRREREPEPIYARYEDDRYGRQPVYESRIAPPRSDPSYYEEYDPRNPGPPLPAEEAPVRQREVRYQ